MFRIITDQAIEDCVQIERCVSLFETEHVETETVIRELGSLSGMEEVLLRLHGVSGRMQEQNSILRQMAQGLDRAVQCYCSSESQICKNADQSVVRHVHREVSMNDFSQLSIRIEEIL